MSDLSPEVAAALLMLAAVSIGFLIGWCVRPDDHTPEDDRDQADYLISHAKKQARTRIRLGRSWRNLFGLWSN